MLDHLHFFLWSKIPANQIHRPVSKLLTESGTLLTSLEIGERFGVRFANAQKRESHANCWGKPESVRVQDGNEK